MMVIEKDKSLKHLNTFGIDAKASYYAEIRTIEDLCAVILHPMYRSAPKLILGGGSNILFKQNFNGLILHNLLQGIELLNEDENFVFLKAGAGVIWHEFVLYAVQHGWGGIENLSLIPGTVGASPIQNIGAYGTEIKDTFYELEAIDLQDATTHRFNATACGFGYRDSIFKREAKGRFMIVSVTFRLSKSPVLNTRYGAIEQELQAEGVTQPTIQDVSKAVIAIRSSKLPDPKIIGNAGSFFKNPEIPTSQFETLKAVFPELPGYPGLEGTTKVAAGYLIEQCGWKGKVIGKVGMHRQQALVLVNHGGATGQELIDHAVRVQDSVLEKFRIHLEMEVNIL